MKIKKELYRSARIVFFTVFCFCSALFFSCENFLNGSDLRKSLEHEIAYANAPYASIQIYADPDAKYTMLPSEGIYDKLYKAGDKFTLDYTPKSSYVFITWECIPENSVEFADSRSTKTEATIRKADEQIKIQPLCVERGKLKVSFSATHGTTVPSEEKSYYSGDAFSLRYTEDGDYAFTGWKIVDLATGQEASDVLEFDGNGKDVTVTVKKTDMSIKVVAESKERPAVMDFAPGYKSEGVYRDCILKFIFSKAMDESSIYWTKGELESNGITEGEYDLFPAELDGETIKNADGELLYYAYRDAGDISGSSLVYKNFTINVRGTTENLLAHYGCPYFDVTKAVLNVPVNQSNLPPKITEIEFKLSSDMVSSEGISLKSSFQKFYFTGATTDNDPPEFLSLNVYQLENDTWGEIKNKDNVDHTDANLFRELNVGAKKLKVLVKGIVTDTGSKPAKLKVFLDPIYTNYYSGQRKVEIGEKSLPSAGTIAEFPDGIEFDFSDADIPQGVYNLSVAAVDNAGKEKIEKFKMVYDHTPPEVSELSYVSTYAQDRLTVNRRNDTKDIYKTEITGFKDNSTKTVTRDENVELIGLTGAAPSRTHTITLTEYDYLGNSASYTKVVQAVPEPGMYYFSDDYWTKDKSRRDWGLWGIITSLGLGKNGNEYKDVRVLAYNDNYWYFYGPKETAQYYDNDSELEKDGLKFLKYIMDNHNFSTLQAAKMKSTGYGTIWASCDYEKKIYVPTENELIDIFSIDKTMINQAIQVYDPGNVTNIIKDDKYYFSCTPFNNYRLDNGWFCVKYAGDKNKFSLMRKERDNTNLPSEYTDRGAVKVDSAQLKLLRQVDFD